MSVQVIPLVLAVRTQKRDLAYPGEEESDFWSLPALVDALPNSY